jgi:hypothetical protein
MNRPRSENSETDVDAGLAADLAALADGSLESARRGELRDQIARSPELQEMLEEQQQALAVLSRATEASAPDALEARVQELVQQRRGLGSLGRRSQRHGRRPSRLIGFGAAAAVAAGVLVAALLVGTGGGGSPTLGEFVALGSRAPTAAAPAKRPRLAQLKVAVDGVPFPYWEDRFGWKASGVRADRIAGHAVTTVFYGDGDWQVAYSIVAGSPPPLRGMSSAHGGAIVWRGGTPYRVQSVNGTTTVVWTRSGRRCILSGRGMSARELVALASWTGENSFAA